MLKFENLSHTEIEKLLNVPESTVGIPISKEECINALENNIPIKQIVAGQHFFLIIFSDDKSKLNLYYSSPGTGTRQVFILKSEVLKFYKSREVCIFSFAWSPHKIKFGIFSKTDSESIMGKETESDRIFRINKLGNISMCSPNVKQVHLYIDGISNASPYAVETWNDTIESINQLIKYGYKKDNYSFNVSITNCIISMIVSAFESYNKKRFLEIEGEGISPNIDSWEKWFKKKSDIDFTLSNIIKEDMINFQNFDKCKDAYKKAYKIGFNEIFDLKDIEQIKKFIKCRHQIVHVSPPFSCLNMKYIPKENPIIATKETVILMRDSFNDFIYILHNETLKLRP